MRLLGRTRAELVDEVFESYLSWRVACENVSSAYRRWLDSAPDMSDLEFAAYHFALDLEERAAMVYSEQSGRAEALAR